MARQKNTWTKINIKNFEKWRKQNNISVSAVMRNLKVSRSAYYQWLNGITTAEIETQKKMAQFMIDKKLSEKNKNQMPKSPIVNKLPSTVPENSSIPAVTASIVTNFLATQSDVEITPDELILFIADIKNVLLSEPTYYQPEKKPAAVKKSSPILKIEERPTNFRQLQKHKFPGDKKSK